MKKLAAAPVWFERRASVLLAFILLVITALAGLALALLDVPAGLKWPALLAVVAWGGVRIWLDALGRGREAIRAFALGQENGLTARLGSGEIAHFLVRRDSSVLGPLVVLRLTGPRGATLVLLPDALEAGALRQVRLWLRWKTDWRESEGRAA